MSDHVHSKSRRMQWIIGILFNLFVWLLDVIICFAVSSTILSVLMFIGLLILYFCLERPAASKQRGQSPHETPPQPSLRVPLLSVVALALCVMLRAIYITWYKVEGHENAKLSDTIIGSFIPFQLFRNYTLEVYPITLHVNKLSLFICLFVFLPLGAFVLSVFKNLDQAILLLAIWIIKRYYMWVHSSKAAKASAILEYELAEKQYVGSLMGASLVITEKEEEVMSLERDIEFLHGNVKRLSGQVRKERNVIGRLEKKIQEQQKLLREQDNLLNRRHFQSDAADDIYCVICMERKRQFLLRPCSHFVVCNICKSTIHDKCPICRKTVKKYEKIFIG